MARHQHTYIFMRLCGLLCICLPGCPPPPPNLAPQADDQSVTVSFNTPKAITLTASDPDNGPQALIYSIVSPPQHGTLTGTPPSVTYTPDTGYSGPDSFTFKADDGEADSNSATVSITVQLAHNRSPIELYAQSVTVAFNTPKAITLTAFDPDRGPQALTYSIVSAPQHGTLTGTPPGVTYTPDTGYSGPDSFTFKANDGEADSDPLTVSITVQAAGGGPGATFTDGDGYPELTGSPLISPVIANGPYWSYVEVTIPYDADTRYVRLEMYDFNTSTLLVQNWAQAVGASGGSVQATVSFPSSTPPDTYYFTFDLCSSNACSNPFKRTTYERTGTGTTYTRVGYESPPLTQTDGPRDAQITIPTFTIQ